MTADEEELAALSLKILALPQFCAAPQRAALFGYLWTNRSEFSPLHLLWHDALYELSRTKRKDDPRYRYEGHVRKSCEDLRRVLRSYFGKAHAGYRIELPSAVVGLGYQLRCTTPSGVLRLPQAFPQRPHPRILSDYKYVMIKSTTYDEGRILLRRLGAKNPGFEMDNVAQELFDHWLKVYRR